MNYLLLIVAAFILLFALKQLSMIRYSEQDSFLKDIKQNVISLLWGTPITIAMLVIPYQVWVIFGSSNDWNGAYIAVGTALLMLIVSFTFYYKNSNKFSKKGTLL